METETINYMASPGIINDEVIEKPKEITLESIDKAVCKHFNLTQEELRLPTRKKEIKEPRQIAMYFAKNKRLGSLAAIGKYFGGFDHATVLHADKTINNIMFGDRMFRDEIQEIENLL